MTRDWLLGTWELVSYESFEPDGRTRRPFGDAIGRITYDAAGNMTGQVMRPGRATVDPRGGGLDRLRAAYTGYIAYFGNYELSADGGTIVHHVAGALNPAMVGGDQHRRVRFEGEDLVLEAAVQKPDGIARHVLRWRKST
jgi:hypothetical protein